MNSRALIGLAAVFFVMALALAWLGIQLSTAVDPGETVTEAPAPEEAPAKPDPDEMVSDGVTVVFAARNLEAGELVEPADLYIETLRRRPPLAFVDEEQVVGLMVEAPVRQGEMLLHSRFARASQLSRGLRPGEQAVAISVNDVVGAGGFLHPGDRVDVLLFLAERGGNDSAQRTHADLRVLAYGADLAVPADGVVDERDGDDARRTRGSATAVLAVPDDKVTSLMLADNAGTLRLAARPAEERHPGFEPAAVEAETRGPDAARIEYHTLRNPEDADERRLVGLDAFRPEEPDAEPAAPARPPVFLHRGTEREAVWP